MSVLINDFAGSELDYPMLVKSPLKFNVQSLMFMFIHHPISFFPAHTSYTDLVTVFVH